MNKIIWAVFICLGCVNQTKTSVPAQSSALTANSSVNAKAASQQSADNSIPGHPGMICILPPPRHEDSK